ncbi:MAG: SusC/RagA family TonB-linked outer membrane protein [Mucilaginibacter sp.]
MKITPIFVAMQKAWPSPKVLLVMKLTTLLIVVALLQTSAKSYSQVTLNAKNAPLKRVLKSIKKQTGYALIYEVNILPDAKITVSLNNATISEALAACLKDLPVTYQLVKNNVVLQAKQVQESGKAKAEQYALINISGTVTGANGQAIPGATIKLKGTGVGAITDGDGKFELKNIPSNGTLVISSIGYNEREVQINNQVVLHITLTENSKELSQVIVVGYGSQKRSDITGSIASVPKDRLQNLPVTNVLQSIEGSVPGVNITSTSASAPGSVGSINIRGLHSITASNAPLIVLDGIIYYGSYNDINTNDVESIEVLKDASATAIYGTRGSNGVLLITTKKGKTGKPSVQYNGYAGPEYMAHEVTPMNGTEYAAKNLAYDDEAGLTPAPVPNQYEQENYKNGHETDWIKAISQQGYIQNHSLNVSGGTPDVKYYVSGDYMNEKGLLKGYQYHRFNIRSNLSANITSWLTTGTNLFFNNNNYDGGRANLFMAAAMSPYGQEYNAQGGYQVYPMYPEELYTNPLLGLYEPNLNRTTSWNGNAYAEIKPAFVPGLKYRFNVGYTSSPGMTGNYTGRNTGDLIGDASVTNTQTTNLLIENIVSYTHSFGKSSLDITGLYSSEKDNTFTDGLTANTFINDVTSFYNLGSAQYQQTTTNFTQSTLESQMIRVNYSYDSKYLLTATARRDGFSGFSANHKYGIFPSVAVAWNIDKEPFMQNISEISQLKLRASYGISGNEGVAPYRTLTTLGSTQYINGSSTVIGLIPNALGNSNLKWESTKGLNLGLDFSILKDRISGTIDGYDTKTYNLLLNRKIPYITGYTTILDNIGKTANQGMEFSITGREIKTDNFTWETNVNFSANRNKLVELYGDNKDDITNNLFLGKPLDGVYDYKKIGIWQAGDNFSVDPSAKPGDLKFADVNGDGKINSSDRTYLGTQLPKYIAGMTNTFRYKDFSLSIFIQTVQGVLKSDATFYDFRDQAGRINLPADFTYWTPANKSNTSPSLSYTNSRQYTYPSNASYTRIKDMTLSYNFPKSTLNKLKIPGLQIYASGRNLATFTKWKGWDPEVDPSGYATNQGSSYYPLVASVVLGINVTLQ